jgi:DNA repair exonuclease SbcCD nuclease subunit
MEKLETETFSKAMDICIQRKVDFILICGDLFHVGIPDLAVVREAIVKMREVRQQGIPIYVIYGSHDYTPTGTSIIDLIESAGLIVNVAKGRVEDGKLKLDFFQDERTRAKLVGISARKIGLESKYYEILDRESLELEEGFKIFAFHSGLDEFKPEYLSQMETVPISFFPRGFDYYAGGHIHDNSENRLPGYERVVFPGPLFSGNVRDLEKTAKGQKRGFYIIGFEDKVESLEFVELKLVSGVYFGHDVTGQNSLQTQKDLKEKISQLDVKDKFVVLRIRGELSGGKTSDLNFPDLREILFQGGALYLHLNRYGLTSKDYVAFKAAGEDIDAIESKLFQDNIGSVNLSIPALQRDSGVKLSQDLLRSLRGMPKPNESKQAYEDRLREQALELLGLGESFED